MKSKKGIELSVNFIVILILSIVVFSFGLIFISKVSKTATEMELPSEEQFYLEACLNEGKTVCIGANRKEMRVKETAIFGLGISNTIGTLSTFFVHNEFSRATLDSEEEFDDSVHKRIKTIEQVKEYEVENNENQNVLLSYSVPQGAESGEYVFNIYVCVDGHDSGLPTNREKCPSGQGTYGGLHKVYIDVI